MKTSPKTRYELIAPPNPYAALIFDCDGTLADTMPLHYQAWVKALGLFDAELSEVRFYELAGMPSADIVQLLKDERGYDLDIEATFVVKERLFGEMIHKVEEIQAVANVARDNFGKVPMAVASGGLRSVVERTLETVGLLPVFDVIITAEDVHHGKPAPDMFLLAAERMGVDSRQCVVYEDADLGLKAAAAAGMRAIDVRVLWQDGLAFPGRATV